MNMSVVIIGGNERMVYQYKEICKKHKCKSRIFPKMVVGLKDKIGSADLIILFTSTVSHNMVRCATEEANKRNISIQRSHTSSASALKGILSNYC